MDDKKTRSNNNTFCSGNGVPWRLNCAFDLFVQVPQRVQRYLKSLENGGKNKMLDCVWPTIEEQSSTWDVNLTKQLQTWKENPSWVDQPPEIKVSVPKGSLCNLSVKFQVGLPPDAIYNIVTNPDNKRVFKNIKEVISRKVLVDEGLRQVVEVEQAALWRFLWWSGTISVHVFVDQNRRNHTVKFKQGKSGFMKKFEGCWTLQPIFIDEESCSPYKPMTLADYDSCTGGKGRVGSIVSLEQLIQPSLVPPPPISWYLRGITAKTTEMLVTDLLAEAARLRSNIDDIITSEKIQKDNFKPDGCPADYFDDVKERWHHRRRRVRQL